jgi:tetratricopeptide (TPR) repeat protein
MIDDAWGQPVVGGHAGVDAWNRAWEQLLHFEGDPIATLADVNEHDDRFVLGSAFTAMYSILGGVPHDAPIIVASCARGRERLGNDERERRFVEAAELVVRGNFTRAAAVLDTISAERADLAAVRLAHDIYLHVGNTEARLRSTRAAIRQWPSGATGASFVHGQHAFALEEAGLFDEAERVGRDALEADPLDLWARHALAHVYQSTNDLDAGFALLGESVHVWSRQESLAAHIWWHLALLHLEAGQIDTILDIHDRLLPDANSPFRLCDLTSTLWRLELLGHDVGDRWRPVADRWAMTTERQTSAFLDVHAAMAFARCPDHDGAASWSEGLSTAWEHDGSENADTFRYVVRPVAAAVAAYARGDFADSSALFDVVSKRTAQVGGSNVQRDILTATHRAANARITALTKAPGAQP